MSIVVKDGRPVTVAPSKTAGLYQKDGRVWPWAWQIAAAPPPPASSGYFVPDFLGGGGLLIPEGTVQ